MSLRTCAIVGAAIVCAASTAGSAQTRGTMEFGAFGSAATFDNSLSLKTGYGGGGRVGMFLDRRWSIEFEDAEMRATRPTGLTDVNVGILSGRLVGVPIENGALSLLVGGGAGVSTETNFMHTYGLDALVGAKLKLTDNVSFRVDGVWDWLANQNWKSYKSVRAGLSVYRRPARETRIVSSPPITIAHADSVSADETRRLRDRDAALRALRDSLRNAPAPVVMVAAAPSVTSAATMATMQAQIHFAFDKSDLTDSAKTILDDKIGVFRANPTMAIVIAGYTDTFGTDAYNMALGMRRAEAASVYIVNHGIDASRVIVETKGEADPITASASKDGQAPNRRAVFRLLIAPDVVKREQ